MAQNTTTSLEIKLRISGELLLKLQALSKDQSLAALRATVRLLSTDAINRTYEAAKDLSELSKLGLSPDLGQVENDDESDT